MSAAIGYYGRIATDGLVLYMDSSKRASYPGFGNSWSSVAKGQTVSGSLINGAVYMPSNTSIFFDSTNDYCQLQALGLDYPLNISMVAIVPPGLAGNGIAVSFSDPTANNKSIGVNIGPEVSMAQIRAWYFSAATGFQAAIVSNPSFNTLYCVSANYTTSSINLYINGAFGNSLTLAQTKQWTETSTSYNIGRLNRLSTIYYGGYLFQTTVYNRVLTASEILQNYNAIRGRFGL